MLLGTFGVFRPHILTVNSEFTITARTVEAMIEIRIAPRTLRTNRTRVSSRPKAKTTTGQPSSRPVEPSCTGTGGTAVRLTKPASTRPMKAMNSPMPTLIACLRANGIASRIVCRSPVRTSSTMPKPSITTRPIASGQVMVGARVKATREFRPSPVAMASGRLPTMPMSAVMTAATRAVEVVSCATDSTCPCMSLALPRMIGFSTTM